MNDDDLKNALEVTRQLESLLTRQEELYARLRSLADRQRHLVTQDDPHPLLELLGERQKVVDDLTGLSEMLVPAQRSWRRLAGQIDLAARQRIEDRLQRISQTLQSVLDSDAEDARHLAARKQRTVQEVQHVGAGQRALVAYQAAGTGAGEFLEAGHSA